MGLPCQDRTRMLGAKGRFTRGPTTRFAVLSPTTEQSIVGAVAVVAAVAVVDAPVFENYSLR
eukprot:m.55201 g.55201  ORF g.55201 m.55201 type:complete len:62 (+) comp12514_c1_seq1:1293-1478(+)